jgi:hypothetical protein
MLVHELVGRSAKMSIDRFLEGGHVFGMGALEPLVGAIGHVGVGIAADYLSPPR